MKITSYNHHVRRLLSFREALVLKPRLPDSIEPSLLSNQGSRRVLGANLTCWAGWPSLWVPSRLKAAPPFVVFKGWVPRTLRAKPVHSRTNFEVPTLAKNARVGQPQLWWSQEHSNAGWASPPRSSEYVSGWWPLAAFLQRCGFWHRQYVTCEAPPPLPAPLDIRPPSLYN